MRFFGAVRFSLSQQQRHAAQQQDDRHESPERIQEDSCAGDRLPKP
jgi:hypothetical protein